MRPIENPGGGRRARVIGGILLGATLITGCAHAPSTFPVRSAASPEAAPADATQVARALSEDPPLPGASTTGWTGLAAPQGPDPHAGHHMHHGAAPMVMPEAPAPQPGAAPEEEHHAH